MEQINILINSCLVCPEEESTEFSETVLTVFAVGYDEKHLVLSIDPAMFLQGQLYQATLQVLFLAPISHPRFQLSAYQDGNELNQICTLGYGYLTLFRLWNKSVSIKY